MFLPKVSEVCSVLLLLRVIITLHLRKSRAAALSFLGLGDPVSPPPLPLPIPRQMGSAKSSTTMMLAIAVTILLAVSIIMISFVGKMVTMIIYSFISQKLAQTIFHEGIWYIVMIGTIQQNRFQIRR